MILLLDTSTPTCRVTVLSHSQVFKNEWQADRSLAKGLLGYLKSELMSADAAFGDLTGIGVYAGPGSFTGLRIGITVANTIASSQDIPIVGGTGGDWQDRAVERLKAGESDNIVMPIYGSEANITKPRK
jgi:tRNA threonylcarbamoyladenosine biosynthesis protein TsaB